MVAQTKTNTANYRIIKKTKKTDADVSLIRERLNWNVLLRATIVTNVNRVALAVLVAWGVRESSFTNNIFTALNLITVCTVIVTGFYKGTLLCQMMYIYIYIRLTVNVFSELLQLVDPEKRHTRRGARWRRRVPAVRMGRRGGRCSEMFLRFHRFRFDRHHR